HEVLLFEKEKRLGGNLHLAAAPPSKKEIGLFTDYLTGRAYDSGVRVEMGVSLGRDDILGIAPDALILALGGIPMLPAFPGIDQDGVFTAEDILLERVEAGKRVVVIGGGSTGCDTAHYLLHRGHSVVIIELMPHIGRGIEAITRRWMYYQFKEAGLDIRTNHTIIRLAESKAFFTDEKGEEGFIEGDAFVLATGYRPRDDFSFCLERDFPVTTHRIGDCLQPGTIRDAVTQGAHLAAEI
ncbi:FAD-dependent oxidoreductase, partial [Thermodesulfobacteriota bacterium]